MDLIVTSSFFFFLMIRRPPRSTLDRSSAASDVYKRQVEYIPQALTKYRQHGKNVLGAVKYRQGSGLRHFFSRNHIPVSYTHLRAHETVLDLVCRLLLEKKNIKKKKNTSIPLIKKVTDSQRHNALEPASVRLSC